MAEGAWPILASGVTVRVIQEGPSKSFCAVLGGRHSVVAAHAGGSSFALNRQWRVLRAICVARAPRSQHHACRARLSPEAAPHPGHDARAASCSARRRAVALLLLQASRAAQEPRRARASLRRHSSRLTTRLYPPWDTQARRAAAGARAPSTRLREGRGEPRYGYSERFGNHCAPL